MKLSNVSSPRGAPMGRHGTTSEPLAPVKMHLQRVQLDSGGYDNGGAYWGFPNDLWRAWGDGPTEQQEVFLRAGHRADAKRHVVAVFPNATFYR